MWCGNLFVHKSGVFDFGKRRRTWSTTNRC